MLLGERHTLETLLGPLIRTSNFGKVAGGGLRLVLTLASAGGISNSQFCLREWGTAVLSSNYHGSGIVLSLLTATLAASVLVSLRAATVRQAAQQLVLPL